MKKHSMLAGAVCIVLASLYGIGVAAAFSPVAPAIIVTSVLNIVLVCYIEANKRRVLV